jgi:hypothetical protein
MTRCTILGAACALAVSLSSSSALLAQSSPPQIVSVSASDDFWTVLTMAPDGSWGTATDISTNRAIARAIGNCKAMSQAAVGCGAYFTTIRAGWSLGITCGSQNILVAEKNLADAEQAAVNRIIALRRLYVPDMPPCMRVVTVDPHGAIVAPKADDPSRRAHSIDVKTAGDIPVWKTITLGTYRDVNALREHLDSRHCGLDETAHGSPGQAARVPGTMAPLQCGLGDSAAEIIGRPAFTLSKTRTDVNLVLVSVSELGFKDKGATMADIYARAQQLGLELCPAEVGPQLRLQYLDQPLGEFLHIAMKPIATYGGDLVDLTVGNGGASLLLIGGDVRSDSTWHSSIRFVFVRPARVAQQIP